MPTELLLDGFNCKRDCNRFQKCHYLCPPIKFMVKKLEYEPQQEEQLDFNDNIGLQGSSWPGNSECTGTMAIKKYFLHRKTPKEIAAELEVSVSYIYRTIREGKKIIAQNIKKKVHNHL